MELIDTHSHLDTHSFTEDRREVLERSRTAGVVAQILPGVCRSWWPNLLVLCRQEADLFPALGLHPLYLHLHTADHLAELTRHAESGSLVALGEIGLDFYHKDPRMNAQYELFEAQLQIAKKYRLPILLHVRKAHDQVQAMLRRKRFDFGGIVHAFSGSRQQAEHYLKLGFAVAFGGTITYDRATKIQSVARALPLTSIVLETDAPDIPPAPYNNRRNSPEYLPLVLEALARIRSEPVETIAAATTANARKVLDLKTR